MMMGILIIIEFQPVRRFMLMVDIIIIIEGIQVQPLFQTGISIYLAATHQYTEDKALYGKINYFIQKEYNKEFVKVLIT